MVYPFYDRDSYLTFLAIFFGVICYVAIVKVFNKDTVEYLYNAICIITLINIGYLWLQYFNIDPLFNPHNAPVGLMGNRNFASTLLAFGFPAFLRKKWYLFIPLLVIGFIQTKTTGGVIAVVTGLIVYVFINRLSLWFLLVPVLAGIGYFVFVDTPDISLKSSRFQAWYFSLVLFKEHWLLGAGIGHWKIIGKIKLPVLCNQWWICLHNEFLQGLFEMGIGFILVITGYFINIFRRLGKESVIPFTALTIISVNSLVNFPFHIGTTALIAVIWLAILEIKLRGNYETV